MFIFKIEALPEVMKAVGDKVEVYLDGGIRDGTDVFKGLALGAKMVCCLLLCQSILCIPKFLRCLWEGLHYGVWHTVEKRE